MRRFRGALLTLAIVLSLGVGVWLLLWWVEEQERRELVISTGTPGGTYLEVGDQLARVIEEYPGDRIASARAVPSAGTLENIERVLSGDADLGLAIEPVVAAHPRVDEMRALMFLYRDRMHIVVSKSSGAESLSDLRGRRVYVGADDSGTRWLATRVLAAAGIGDGEYSRVAGDVVGFADASLALQSGRADAAFFVSSTLAKAVSDALASGCCKLLDLGDHEAAIRESVPGMEAHEIPARIYPNQPDSVITTSSAALLITRRDLPEEVALELDSAIFDNLAALNEAHIPTQEVRLARAFAKRPSGVAIHPGSLDFVAGESEKLLIATGTINGKYYRIGKQIELVLREAGIPARVTQTDGSVENLGLLSNDAVHALAIVQYDVALASYWSERIYATKGLGIPRVRGMRRLATLHEEKLHALIRREAIPERERKRPTLRALRGARVCAGPAGSGTQALARAILRRHGVVPAEVIYLSVPDMTDRLHGGEIDAGFFVSHVPNESLKTLVHAPSYRLLSVDPKAVRALLGPAMGLSQIEPGVYGAQAEGEPPVETVATWAVLVTRDDLPFDVQAITEAVFEGAGFLGISETTEGMARELPSLPLHAGAHAYYRESGRIPSTHIDWLTVTWRSLTILVILGAALRGALTMSRNATERWFRHRVLEVPVDDASHLSVARLIEIRREVRAAGYRPPWRRTSLDAARVSELEGMINQRIEECRESLKRGLLAALRVLRPPTDLDDKGRLEQYDSLERQIWICLEDGELDAPRRNARSA
jgi:TRAP transporter TAXI family solute receptor